MAKKTKPQPNKKMVPIAKASVTRSVPPKVKPIANGTCINHREYFGVVNTYNGAGQITAYINKREVNAASSECFPWLAELASKFEFYKFKKLNIIYKPVCPTTVNGSVSMFLDYDCTDGSPNTKSEFMQNSDAVTTNLYNEIILKFKPQNARLPKYLTNMRNAATTSGYPLQRNVANFFTCVQGASAANDTYGELYVEYEVELTVPTTGYLATCDLTVIPTNNGSSLLPDGFATITGTRPVSVRAADANDLSLYGTTNYYLEFDEPFIGTIEAVLTGTGFSTTHSDAINWYISSHGKSIRSLLTKLLSCGTKTCSQLFIDAAKGVRIAPVVTAITTATALAFNFSRYDMQHRNLYMNEHLSIHAGSGYSTDYSQVYVDGVLHPSV